MVVGAMAGPAWSQEVTAAIVGTVTDPSGAPINGASVTVTDTERGNMLTARTSDVGAYNVLRVPVGTYSLKVSAPGFQTAAYPAFHAATQPDGAYQCRMKVGQVSETVEVTVRRRYCRPSPPKSARSSTARTTTICRWRHVTMFS